MRAPSLIGLLKASDTIYLMGTNKLGRDLLSRLIHGTRISMSIGLIGVSISLDQRVIEVISSMPSISLRLGLAREVRGRFFALRSEDFVTAARLDGSSERRLIFRHILPSLTSHILAVVTLALPTMIVAETALSFLGNGLKAPVVSLGGLTAGPSKRAYHRHRAVASHLAFCGGGADGTCLQFPW